MSRFFHALMMHGYRSAIEVAAVFGNAKARAWLDMRKGNLERIQLATAALSSGEKWVWFHCASVGEFEQAQPVMKSLRENDESLRFLLTFYSPSGWHSFANRKPSWWRNSDASAAMPLDTSTEVRNFLNAMTPVGASAPAVQLLALAKYEVWPVLIHEIKKHAPVALFAGHVIPGRWPFRAMGGFHREAWRNLSKVLVQSESSVAELRRWDIAAEKAGDPRFDRVLDSVAMVHAQPNKGLQDWVGKRPCLVVGSAWEAESRIAQAAWSLGMACIVVPHEWDARWAKQQQLAWKKCGATAIVWSELHDETLSAESDASFPQSDVVLLDAMGQLMHAYGVGQLALVGGGFGKGVHNTLEPAAHGLAIWTGPKVGRFAEVRGLMDCGALETAQSEVGCAEALSTAWGNSELLKKRGLAARQYAQRNAGAGPQIAAQLSKMLDR